ncbi:HI1506-related protein [Xenorhabdus nematophila]|uniref:HI1506-related protein n=1 Tax=Xenorhabdus nematophila TaxID=628 RepID=UPI0032B7B810
MPILITAKVAGFRRCGIAHSDNTTSYPDDRFSAAQLRELQADPMLVVSVVSDTEVQPQHTDSEFDALRAEISRLTAELDTVTAKHDVRLQHADSQLDALRTEVARLSSELDIVTAERDTLKQAQTQAATSKDAKKSVKPES